MCNGKTITIYLPEGNPTGIKIASYTNHTAKAIVIPRDKLKLAKTREELQQPGVYFLFGCEQEDIKENAEESNEELNSHAYIGKAENAYKRILQHDTLDMKFWDTAVVLISQSNGLTQAHVQYLEAMSIKIANTIDRYELENETQPTLINLPEHTTAENNNFFEITKILLSTLGYPILKELPETDDTQITYHFQGNNFHGKMIYAENSFILLPGSLARVEESNSFGGRSKEDREKLIKNSMFEKKGEQYRLNKKFLCNSASRAANIIAGRYTNGRTARKDKDRNTLDENERTLLEE